MAEPDNERANRLKTVPVTVLFADIVDSIDLYARLGNEAAKQLIDGLFNDLSHLVADHRGTVVKSIGDELMCSFHLPLFAINAARDMQRLTGVRNGTRTEQIQLRIGFHAGNVIAVANDFFGDTVNIASRVAAVASSGRILTTGQTLDLVSAHDAGLMRPWRRELLKGLTEPIELYEVLWADAISGGEMRNTSLGSYQPPVFHQLVLRFQDATYSINAQRPLLSIGRHPASNVVVQDESAFVSSHHAKIEFRGGVFVLTDTSLNGTYVALGGSDYFRVKLPFTLESAGKIIFGYPPAHPHQIAAAFEVV